MVSQFSGRYFEDWPPSEMYHYDPWDSYEEAKEGAHVEKAQKLEDHRARARLTRTKAPKYCELTDSCIPFFHLSSIIFFETNLAQTLFPIMQCIPSQS